MKKWEEELEEAFEREFEGRPRDPQSLERLKARVRDNRRGIGRCRKMTLAVACLAVLALAVTGILVGVGGLQRYGSSVKNGVYSESYYADKEEFFRTVEARTDLPLDYLAQFGTGEYNRVFTLDEYDGKIAGGRLEYAVYNAEMSGLMGEPTSDMLRIQFVYADEAREKFKELNSVRNPTETFVRNGIEVSVQTVNEQSENRTYVFLETPKCAYHIHARTPEFITPRPEQEWRVLLDLILERQA